MRLTTIIAVIVALFAMLTVVQSQSRGFVSPLSTKSGRWIEFAFDFEITPPLERAELEWYNSDFSPDQATQFGHFIGQDLYRYGVSLRKWSFVYYDLKTLRFSTYWDADSSHADGYSDYNTLLSVLNSSGYDSIKALFDKSLNEGRTHRFATITYRQQYFTSHCFDGIRNQDETGIDCGGSDCPRCQPGQGCGENMDCSQYSICVATADFKGDAIDVSDRPVPYEVGQDGITSVCSASQPDVEERNWSGYSTSSATSTSTFIAFAAIAFFAILF